MIKPAKNLDCGLPTINQARNADGRSFTVLICGNLKPGVSFFISGDLFKGWLFIVAVFLFFSEFHGVGKILEWTNGGKHNMKTYFF